MPVLNKDILAKRLRHNWNTRQPTISPCLDDSLTSLNWLHNINIMKVAGAHIDGYTTGLDSACNSKTDTYSNTLNSNYRHTKDEPIDYTTNPFVKPPYSYATLICMAMRETKKNKIALSSIYGWITKNFMYYRMADPSWQNSIRHNLSLNKCFEKVPRRKDEPGKGGFWRLSPDFTHTMENGIFKKRRISCDNLLGSRLVKTECQSDSEEVDENVNDDPNMGVGLSHFGEHAHELEADEMHWREILNQDICVEGTRVKAERIIDVTDNFVTPLEAMNTQACETLPDHFEFDSLLGNDPYGCGVTCNTPTSPLDLTITGTSIHPPDWWFDTLNNNVSILDKTPITSSPIHHLDFTERHYFDGIHAAFDLDNLFDIDDAPSPNF